MGRCKNDRQIMAYPAVSGFSPNACQPCNTQPVTLSLDEYEAIRLLDYMGKQQTQAALIMGISRPTLTRIYMEARHKIATMIVEGRPLDMSAGNKDFDFYKPNRNNIIMMNQKIAIPTCEGKLWPHFGKAPQVTVVTVENGQVKETLTLKAPEHEHGAMPRFIAAQGCTDVLCGGLGAGAVNLLNQLGIQVHAGAPELPIEELVTKYLGNQIIYGDGNCHHEGCGSHHHHDDNC